MTNVAKLENNHMNLDKIDLEAIPGLDVATAMFGSAVDGVVYNDGTIGILVYIYDNSALQALT